MDEEMPYWYKLILGWVAKGHDGLTIPFILGAERHINGTGEFNDDEIINLLLKKMVICADAHQGKFRQFCTKVYFATTHW